MASGNAGKPPPHICRRDRETQSWIRTARKPGLNRRDCSIRRKRHDPTSFEIADDRFISMISAHGPIVDAVHRYAITGRGGPATDDPKQRVVADRRWVSGGPWNTLVLVEWVESNSATDGVRTENSGVHVMRLSWGRATRLAIRPDTIGLKAALDRMALAGVAEANAPPIVD
jgi:hypothetical protein